LHFAAVVAAPLSPNAMRNLWRIVDVVGSALRDCVLALIGHRRVKLGEWPDRGIVAATVDTVNDLGGRRIEQDIGFGFDEVLYFSVLGRRVRLVVEEYGNITLWGAKWVVLDLSKRIAEKLSTEQYETGSA
jgi:hypothetical protein